MKSPHPELKPRSFHPATLAVAGLAVVTLVGMAWGRSGPRVNGDPTGGRVMSTKKYTKPPVEQLRKSLTGVQFQVTQNAATEPPFDNAFWDNHQPGLYVDVVTGEPLFSSTDKFDSGTGWPSFTRPVEKGRVVDEDDRTPRHEPHGGSLRRRVVAPGARLRRRSGADRACATASTRRRCASSPSTSWRRRATAPTCLCSARPPTRRPRATAPEPNSCTRPAAGGKPGCTPTLETAVLAGGCFWGMEEIIRQVPGVIETQVGYTGGKTAHPTYEDVHTGATGHAEAIRVVFDPAKLSYDDLLEKWFFRMHDPTTPNRQGNDRGSQYRSAIFVTSPEQRKVAEQAKARAQASGRWKSPIVTEIVEAGAFTPAEDYHQKYLEKNPGGYTCHYVRN